MNRPQNLSRPPSYRGFTLIELMVTIGIIIILVSILFVAIGHVERSAKTNNTNLALANLKGLLSELDSATQLSSDFPGWAFHDNAGAGTYIVSGQVLVPGTTVDFWRLPYVVAGTLPYGLPLVAPGDVTSASPDERDASIAVLNTTLAMNALGRVTANRNAINGLASDRKFIPTYSGNQRMAPGSDRAVESTDSTEVPSFPTGCTMQSGGTTYSCPPNASGVGILNSSGPPTGWTIATSATPMLLDGWNNPIIFVPATGLHLQMLNGASAYNGTATQNWIIVSPEGRVSGNGTANPIVVTPGRPFWASAGPDGDFSKGDDNIYSFEQ